MKKALLLSETGAYSDKILSIGQWLENGAKVEDHPMCRAFNHFLNPYEPLYE